MVFNNTEIYYISHHHLTSIQTSQPIHKNFMKNTLKQLELTLTDPYLLKSQSTFPLL